MKRSKKRFNIAINVACFLFFHVFFSSSLFFFIPFSLLSYHIIQYCFLSVAVQLLLFWAKQKRSPASRGSISNRRNLEHLDEGELFMELIRDVSNELDINILYHKILVNVGLLTHADRASLFLAKGTPYNRYLVAKLFDVTQNNGEYSLFLM